MTKIDSPNLRFDVTLCFTGWGTALHRWPKVKTVESPLQLPLPAVDSVRLRKLNVKVASFTFPESPASFFSPPADDHKKSALTKPPTTVQPPRSATRIKPPSDIIRLEDRLYYVLQPPLENLLTSNTVHMPFEPFPYQYQGVAFLYPRFAAILADEMGLGKTMQAITAVRLLLRSGEARSILLICPKPLVTNWKREFSQWAPEVPLCIIEGDMKRRRWQWQELNAPVKIANYELLMRDRDLIVGQSHFDLVVLDEAQRIKNRSSTTSEIARSISRTRSWALTGTPSRTARKIWSASSSFSPRAICVPA